MGIGGDGHGEECSKRRDGPYDCTMPGKAIRIRGARTHNLQDLDLDLPRDALTVVCGVSGSGKSSLVLDTLGAESRRRFLGTLSRVPGGGEATPRPDVDRIEGLPPAVSAGFTAREPGPRQTLGTLTEVTHALRALFARAATPHCPVCDAAIGATTRDAILGYLLQELAPRTRVVLLAPRGRGAAAVEAAARDGFVRVRSGGGPVVRVEEVPQEELEDDVRVDVVVDRLIVKPDAVERFAASIEQGLDLGAGVLAALVMPEGEDAREEVFSDRPWCAACERTWPRLSPAVFASTSPRGACERCEGRGTVPVLDPERVLPRRLRLRRVAGHLRRHVAKPDQAALEAGLEAILRRSGLASAERVSALSPEARLHLLEGGARGRPRGLLGLVTRGEDLPDALTSPARCPDCDGTRLAPYGRAARLAGETLPDLESRTVDDLLAWIASVDLTGDEGRLAAPARADAEDRLRFLAEVGLGYLPVARAAAGLSGGERRRARLAAACAARMSGLLFLLDEPTAGLHPVERPALRARIRALVDEGNTVVCVEHDPAFLADVDHIVELGPGAGAEGGRVLDAGPRDAVLERGSIPMVRWLREEEPPPPRVAPRVDDGRIRIRGARCHNLQRIDVALPRQGFTCLTGVSGAGKSTLLLDVLAPAAAAMLDRAPFPEATLDALEGLDGIERVSVARGAPPRHPRATPGSVLGVLSPLRRLFAATLEARTRGWAPSRFSRHVRGGRCETCRGLGERRIALRDLAPQRLVCEACEGTGFHRETLEVRVKGLSIADVLDLPLEAAATLFRDIPAAARPLEAAVSVGLGYVPLGEPTSRLSGGEALRLRLASALGRGGHAPTLYLLDEPSAGLHPVDVAHLARVLLRLSEAGDTVVAVEHDLHLVRLADHVVELGPGPGEAGGRVLYEGPPAGLLDVPDSPTGRVLRGEGD